MKVERGFTFWFFRFIVLIFPFICQCNSKYLFPNLSSDSKILSIFLIYHIFWLHFCLCVFRRISLFWSWFAWVQCQMFTCKWGVTSAWHHVCSPFALAGRQELKCKYKLASGLSWFSFLWQQKRILEMDWRKVFKGSLPSLIGLNQHHGPMKWRNLLVPCTVSLFP